MDELKTLETMGFTLPGPAYIFGALLFSIIGYAVYRYGKKVSIETTKWTGIALMLFPYAISETWLLYVVGGCLCISLIFTRR